MNNEEEYLRRIDALEIDVTLLKAALRALELQIKKLESSQKTKSSISVRDEASDEDTEDELLPAAIDVVLEGKQASVSILQRRLKVGYGRAARLVDQMEEIGIIGPFIGTQPRKILITKEQWDNMQQ